MSSETAGHVCKKDPLVLEIDILYSTKQHKSLFIQKSYLLMQKIFYPFFILCTTC